MTSPGCPIRKSPDQTPVCGSPRLIAACHVLHRLLAPRHSPCALSSLTYLSFEIHLRQTAHAARLKTSGSSEQLIFSMSLICQRTGKYRSPTATGFKFSNESILAKQRSGWINPEESIDSSENPTFSLVTAEGLVEPRGIEPLTSGLQSPRSPS